MLFRVLAVALAGLQLALGVPLEQNAIKAEVGAKVDVAFSNHVRYLFDTDGNQVDAYGSKVNFLDGTYYLYGNAYGGSGMGQSEISQYSSNDLVHWKYEGLICTGSAGCGGGRPHIIFNEKTKKYVLWTDNGFDGYQYATSDSPKTPFTKASARAKIDPKHDALKPADFGIETINGTGYAAYSVLNFNYKQAGSIWPPINQSMYISKLNDDYTSTDLNGRLIASDKGFDLIDNEAESPDLFFRNGWFYVSASNTCGNCNGSIGLLYRAKSIDGPWIRQILSGDSCAGQVEGVFPVNTGSGEPTYVWHSTAVPGGPRVMWSGHIFQPLEFRADGSAKELDCAPKASFKISHQAGTKSVPTGKAMSAADGSPHIADYTPVCDSDLFTLYQTFTTSKAGTLKEVSVNVAKGRQLMPLVISVFRFSSYSDLVAPNYIYEKLGSRMVLPSFATDLLTTFNAITVSNLTATVKAGDHIGISITGSDFSPYCHLEYDTKAFAKTLGASTAPKLLVQGAGQNSWRGDNGKGSPVYEREGKSIKFFARID
ncbi:Arabinanase/levansucrase/invertase [Microthyrium microscopicum]|uniref:Arabinanase/levansucrase/invertase n=1 Tax=Microthyrium microscopicum TaxID=703497 RepID=A0A6A6TY81_9PEZI|nr:Arabinanase/levansucrase/invertase [Microthyrium microscopicum]